MMCSSIGLPTRLLCLVLVLNMLTGADAARHTACAVANEGEEVVFDCGGDLISSIEFASYGRPRGTCEAYNARGTSFTREESCHTPGTIASLEDRCLGQSTCLFTVSGAGMGGAPSCTNAADSKRWLAAVLTCGNTPTEGPPVTVVKSGLSIGWRFVILVFFVFGLYCALGIGYNVKNLGAKGLEAVPHREMWLDLPYLVKDGVIFSVDTIKSKGRAQYDAVL